MKKRAFDSTQIDQYLSEQEFSLTTVMSYRGNILAFYKFSNGKPPTAARVKAWTKEMQDKGTGPSHIAQCHYAMKGYCEWLGLSIFAAAREKSRDKVKAPRLRFTEPPRTRSVEEINRLFAECRNPRDTMLLMLLVTTGARISELMGVKVKEDMDYEKHNLALQRKGRRERHQWVHLSDPVWVEVEKYLAWRHGNPSLLLPYSYYELYKAFREMAKRAKVEFPPHSLFHNLRHFVALWQKQQHIPTGAISLLLGHSSQQVTDRIYGALSPEEIQKQIAPTPWEK